MGNMLSVITPAYNESSNISVFVNAIQNVLEGKSIDYEIVIVNDGSTDNTWNEITEKSASNPCVKGISFSRNFGKEAAIMAGLEAAKGDCVVLYPENAHKGAISSDGITEVLKIVGKLKCVK